jgi:hypothetical protein
MSLEPLDYHRKLTEYLKTQEKLWDWFSSFKVQEEQLQKFKDDLLKNTYRMTPESEPEIYEKVNLAKEKLSLQSDVIVYQAQNTQDYNAAISCLPGECHIVLTGQILKLLTPEELLSVIAHELSHAILFTIENGIYEITDRMITSIANDIQAEGEFIETARLFRVYTEVFCDRGSFIVTENLDTVLSSLIKINTGLEKVSVPSYLKQAEEIFSKDKVKTEGLSHPENFIRSRALHLWSTQAENSDNEVRRMIEGDIDMDSLDIFKQKKVNSLTFDVIQNITSYPFMRTPEIMALAGQYFEKYKPLDQTPELEFDLNQYEKSVQEYLVYILIDFALVDGSLEQAPFGIAFQLGEKLGISEQLDKAIQKELKLSDRKLDELKTKSTQILSTIDEKDYSDILDN